MNGLLRRVTEAYVEEIEGEVKKGRVKPSNAVLREATLLYNALSTDSRDDDAWCSS